jgi:tRNA uridine 5-carboxymethylaminomethyl modification enzyme
VQDAFLHEVPGLERAKILQYGYAVEYDYVPTHQTKMSLETKLVGGLFLAGSIGWFGEYSVAPLFRRRDRVSETQSARR